MLRARSREHARKAVAALVNNSVGAGIAARAKTGDRALDKRINALWPSGTRGNTMTSRQTARE